MRTLRISLIVTVVAGLLTLSSACGGAASGDGEGGLLEIVPASAEIAPGQALMLEATAAPVEWGVVDPDGGAIDSAGIYTAPDAEGTYTVAASSPTGEQTTWIRVKRNIRVDVVPTTATLAPGESLALTAAVTTNLKNVHWSVVEGSAGGTVTAAGVYTAPDAPGLYTVVATSAADPSRSDRATIAVTEAPPPPPASIVTISMAPQTASVVAGETLQFRSAVNGATDGRVTWSVPEPDGGAVSETGLYTAPLVPGAYTVVATSYQDPSATSSATVVVSSPTVSKPVISSFAASPSTITQGESTVLSWTVSGDTSLSVDGGVGPVTGTSSVQVSPSSTTTYTLTATNTAGSVTASATVSVAAPAPAPIAPLPPGVVPAFPGAQGGGALSKGGRGGVVYEVTNLNDSGAGSLRACVQASGPRTCVFRVAGNIRLQTALEIRNPYLTVAGQTAPGGGIVLDGRSLNTSLLRVYTNHVTWRYTRIRKGYYAAAIEQAGDVVKVTDGSKYVIFDHNSLSWTQDENVDVSGEDPASGGPTNVTFSWNLIAEPLSAHPTSVMTGGNNARVMVEIDFHHNLVANSSHRNPQISSAHTRLVNNVFYNWGYWATRFVSTTRSDVIGNLYRRGPLSPTSGTRLHEVQASPSGGTPSLYVAGNQGPYMSPDTDNWSAVFEADGSGELRVLSTSYKRTTPMAPPVGGIAIVPEPVQTLESSLLPVVGASRRLDCSGNWVQSRDGVDARIVSEYHAGQGFVPTNEGQVGGFPAIASGTACADADRDGMPDAWETANGSNLNDPSDRNALMPDGFTRLERYLAGR